MGMINDLFGINNLEIILLIVEIIYSIMKMEGMRTILVTLPLMIKEIRSWRVRITN